MMQAMRALRTGRSREASVAVASPADRDTRIDAAKALSITLVVLGHAKGVPDTFTELASSFRVPLFFFLSGWVIQAHGRARTYAASLLNLVRRILVPYLSFFALGYAYWLVTRNIGEKALRWGDRPWWEPLQGLLSGIGPQLYVHPAIWFLLALFVTTAVYLSLRRLLRPAWLVAASLVVAWAWVALFPRTGLRIPFALDILPVSLFYMATGALASHRLKLPETVPASLALAALLAPLWLWLTWSNGRVDMNHLQFGQPSLFFAAALTGIVAVLCVSRCLSGFPALHWIGQNTMVILCTHILVFFVLSGMASLAGGFDERMPGPAWALLVSAIALAASVPLKWLFARHAPWAIGLGVRRGSRP